MGFGEAVRRCLRGWITFSGRAPRSEYWWFALFQILVWIAIGLIFALLGGGAVMMGGGGFGGGIMLVLILLAPLGIFLFIASISATVRRLHDRNMSGWWYGGFFALNAAQGAVTGAEGTGGGGVGIVLSLLVFAASIAIFVLMLLRGTQGPNSYGPDPLNPHSPEVFA